MTPFTKAHLELRLVVQRAEQFAPTPPADHRRLEDYRCQVLADVMDVLDDVEAGLGTRLLLALYPASEGQRQ